MRDNIVSDYEAPEFFVIRMEPSLLMAVSPSIDSWCPDDDPVEF